MSHLLIDTSILVKWFHSEGESELAEARALRTAHVSGDIEAHMLDLALYEFGNVLLRALRWAPGAVAGSALLGDEDGRARKQRPALR